MTLISIRHTGTRYLERKLNPDDLFHIGPGQVDRIRAVEGLIVSPIRHPYLVAESWIRRDGHLDDFEACWDVFMDEVMPRARVIPVDLSGDPPVNAVGNTYLLKPEDIDPAPEAVRVLEKYRGYFEGIYGCV